MLVEFLASNKSFATQLLLGTRLKVISECPLSMPCFEAYTVNTKACGQAIPHVHILDSVGSKFESQG